MPHKSAIVIGSGIAGLAMARGLAVRGYAVTVFERNEKAVGASIRNFGMLWPIGQPNGKLYERALVSKSIWKEICNEADLWYEEGGSLHAAYNEHEQNVIIEFAEANKNVRPVAIVSAEEAAEKSEAVNTENLKCALWSGDEMIIESRVAMQKIPAYLNGKYGVAFHFNTAITAIEYPAVRAGEKNGMLMKSMYAAALILKRYTRMFLRLTRLLNVNCK